MDAQTTEIDMDAASNALAMDLGLGEDVGAVDGLDADIDAAAPAAGEEAQSEAPAADNRVRGPDGKFQQRAPAESADPNAAAELEMPKSWKQEWANDWKSTPRTAQERFIEREKQMLDGLGAYKGDAEYGRSMRGVLAKHEDILRQQGLDAPRAAEYLFNAHRNLSLGTPEQRMEYLGKVAAAYGLKLPTGQTDPNAPPANPELETIRQRQDRIEAAINAENQQRYQAIKQETQKTVEAFASDPKNTHFEECADHIVMLLKADPNMKLEDAYSTAVWANPITRQKELARLQTERDNEARQKTAAAVKNARKATSTNVKGRDTTRAPTGLGATLDKMDEVLSETMEEIKSR